MADTKRTRNPRFTTARGTFIFPKFSRAETKFNANGIFGSKVRFQASDPAVQEMLNKLQPLHDVAVARGEQAFQALGVAARKKLGKITVNPLFNEVYDDRTEEPTGEIEMNISVKAVKGPFKTGRNAGRFSAVRPAVFDARGQEIAPGFVHLHDTLDEALKDVLAEGCPEYWSGTEGRLAFEVGLDRDGEPGYWVPGSGMVGLSLSLQAVQILKAVTGSSRGAAGYGFAAEDADQEEADDAASEVMTNGDF